MVRLESDIAGFGGEVDEPQLEINDGRYNEAVA